MKKLALALLATACTLPAFTLSAQQPLPPAPNKVPLELGAAWYPEQWPESRWDADLTLMEQAHIHFARIGEFAWSTMEPSEGNFQLDWLEHAIRLAEKHHIAIVIGTPTAAPPAWLTQKYPETLRTNADGRKDQHGNRQQFDLANPKYRELCRIIATKLAERFGHDPNVIGWQIDNEYAAEDFGPDDAHSNSSNGSRPSTKHSTTSTPAGPPPTGARPTPTWDQIPIQETYGNPGLLLNWKQFVSDTWRSYQRNQLDAIRAHADKRQFITTNMMGWFDAYDHYTVSQDLDLASWDDYVGTRPPRSPIDNGAATTSPAASSAKTSGSWRRSPASSTGTPTTTPSTKARSAPWPGTPSATAPKPSSTGSGAPPSTGRKQYHGTLVGADGTPVPLYAEVQQLGADFDKAGPALAGTTVHSDVALLNDYPSRWAIDWQRHNKAFDPVNAFMSFYTPLHDAVHSVDIIQPTRVPSTTTNSSSRPRSTSSHHEAAKNLEAYVRNGGHLVLGPRSGHEGRRQQPLAAAPARPARRAPRRPRRAVLRTRHHRPRQRRLGLTVKTPSGPSSSPSPHPTPKSSCATASPTAGSTTNPPPSPANSAKAPSPTSAPRSTPPP